MSFETSRTLSQQNAEHRDESGKPYLEAQLARGKCAPGHTAKHNKLHLKTFYASRSE